VQADRIAAAEPLEPIEGRAAIAEEILAVDLEEGELGQALSSSR
jgi:hypothetical protein